MKRIYDKEKIAVCLGKSKYHAVFDSLDIDFYLVKYEKGELVSSPFQKESFFQIVEQGFVDIYVLSTSTSSVMTAHAILCQMGRGTICLETWISFIPKAAIFMQKLPNV